VYNVLGQKVRTLVQREQLTGEHAVQWHGDDDRGLRVASGVYIYRLHAGDFTASRKLLLLR
jgi:flagellar hook assembly protein FlgD